MSGCTLRLVKNSPLRTTLVDEATGHAKYKIETPMKIARSVTRIRKFESPPHPPLHQREDGESDSSDAGDIADEQKKKKKKKKKDTEEGDETDSGDLPEASDEVARIYWKWFSSNRIIFRGRITTREELLPKCGKLKGCVNLFQSWDRKKKPPALGVSRLLDRTAFSTGGRWVRWV